MPDTSRGCKIMRPHVPLLIDAMELIEMPKVARDSPVMVETYEMMHFLSHMLTP